MKRALLLAALLLAPVAAGADPLEEAKAADRAMSKAVKDADRDAFKAFLSSEVVFLDTPETGREAAAKSWSGYFEEKRLELLQWSPDRGQAAASGDFAWTSGPYDYQRTGPDGKVAHFAGRYLTLWQKNEGKWQVWADGSWLEPAAGGFGAQLARIWPPAGAPDASVKIERKPLATAKSQAGDLLLVVGNYEVEAGGKKAQGRYATVAENDGKGGWTLVAEGLAGPALVE